MPSRVTRTQRAGIFKNSQRIFKSENFDVRITPFDPNVGGVKEAQLFLVTPRIMGNAVARNLFKRRVRAIFYEKNMASCGYHLIVFAKSKAGALSFAQLSTLLVALYQELLARSSLPS